VSILPMNGHSTKHIFAGARRFRLALFAAVLIAACVDTPATAFTTGTGYSIVPTIADSSTYPAGSVVIVRAGVTNNGSILPLSSVSWTVIAGGGSVPSATTPTDSVGIASVAWTLGDTAGINTLVIGVADQRDTLHVRGVIGALVHHRAGGRLRADGVWRHRGRNLQRD
jgi:hypothetical protein